MRWHLLLLLLPIPPAFSQSTVSPSAKQGYSANAGWLDFRPSSASGVRAQESCLSGHAYAANLGWINFGDGTPDNGHSYSNFSATDHGVNLSPEGILTGHAYSANAGWILFEQTHGVPRIDLATGKLSGHIYSANVGWISLETSFTELVTLTLARPDSDGDGIGDAWEMFHFSSLGTASATSDADKDGMSDHFEYQTGTDPQDTQSSFRIVSSLFQDDGQLATISFTTAPGRLYRIDQSLTPAGTWSHGTTFPADPGPVTTRSIFLPGGPRRFIRASALLPLSP